MNKKGKAMDLPLSMQLQFKEDLHQINLKNAIKGKVQTSLTGALSLLTKDRLSSLASMYEVAGRSKMNKQQLAEALAGPIANAENVKTALLITQENQRELLGKLVDAAYLEDDSFYPASYLYFMERGLLFMFYDQDKLIFAVPDEIKEAYRQINLESLSAAQARFDLVDKYLSAAVNLYGICPIEKVREIFNRQNEDQLSESELARIIEAYSSKIQFWFVDGEYVLADYFADDYAHEIDAFLRKVKTKPYYLPGKKEFLKYASTFYFEPTPEMARLKTYIEQNLCKDERTLGALMDDIQLHFSMEASMEEILHEFERRDISFKNAAQLQEMMPLLIDVSNHTRIWSNRGHTPAELAPPPVKNIIPNNMVRIDRHAKPEKVGRNDLCPCGSGKKYKKCCL
jgi:hypothetical protein